MIRRTSVEYLVTKGLGYCCLWFFFSRYRDAEMIAARLGCSLSAVYKQRVKYFAGELVCKKEECCMKR